MSKVVIPDVAEPVVGYRFWTAEETQGLRSVYGRFLNGANSSRPFWPVGSPLTATCAKYPKRRGGRHRAPVAKCMCGIHATKTEEELIPNLQFRLPDVRQGLVLLGQVDLTGKVQVHKGGFRAEKAQVRSLLSIGVPCYDQAVDYYSLLYEVPVVKAKEQFIGSSYLKEATAEEAARTSHSVRYPRQQDDLPPWWVLDADSPWVVTADSLADAQVHFDWAKGPIIYDIID